MTSFDLNQMETISTSNEKQQTKYEQKLTHSFLEGNVKKTKAKRNRSNRNVERQAMENVSCMMPTKRMRVVNRLLSCIVHGCDTDECDFKRKTRARAFYSPALTLNCIRLFEKLSRLSVIKTENSNKAKCACGLGKYERKTER